MEGNVKVLLRQGREGTEVVCVTLTDGGDLSVNLFQNLYLSAEDLMTLGALANDVDVSVEVKR